MKGRLLKTNYYQSALGIVNDRAVRILRLTLRFAFSLIVILPSMEFTANVAAAQSTEAEVSARLVGKPLYLRGFWGEDKLAFDAAGQPVEHYPRLSFTESGFDASKVEIHGDHMRIEGQRVGLTFDQSGSYKRLKLITRRTFKAKPEPELMILEIDGHGGQDFSRALDAIFAGSLEDLVPSLPEYWQEYAQTHFLHSTNLAGGSAETLDRSHTKSSKSDGSVKPPKLIKNVDPRFTESARQMRLSGSTEVYLWLSEDGMPSHLKVVRPIGLGLDEESIAAVSQYRFAPATKDGKPVKVDLYINVNYGIF